MEGVNGSGAARESGHLPQLFDGEGHLERTSATHQLNSPDSALCQYLHCMGTHVRCLQWDMEKDEIILISTG